MEKIPLKDNELEVLRILWEEGDLKPSEIEARFSWEIENATLRSVLVNLVETKHILRKRDGKAFRYATQLPKATVLQATMRALARVFSGGSTQDLVAQLVKSEALSPADLELLQKTASGAPGAKRGEKGARK